MTSSRRAALRWPPARRFVAAGLLLLAPAGLAHAQSQSQELDELKAKVEQMQKVLAEQAKQIQALQAQRPAESPHGGGGRSWPGRR